MLEPHREIQADKDYLSEYDRFDYYKKNFVQGTQNTEMRKEDEKKFFRRSDEDYNRKTFD